MLLVLLCSAPPLLVERALVSKVVFEPLDHTSDVVPPGGRVGVSEGRSKLVAVASVLDAVGVLVGGLGEEVGVRVSVGGKEEKEGGVLMGKEVVMPSVPVMAGMREVGG